MPKVFGPLQSVSASGKIGERLVFSKRKSGQQARFQRCQKDVVNPDRTAARAKYTVAFSEYNKLSANTKLSWKEVTYSQGLSGYNFYIKLSIKQGVGNLIGQRLFGLYTFGID